MIGILNYFAGSGNLDDSVIKIASSDIVSLILIVESEGIIFVHGGFFLIQHGFVANFCLGEGIP